VPKRSFPHPSTPLTLVLALFGQAAWQVAWSMLPAAPGVWDLILNQAPGWLLWGYVLVAVRRIERLPFESIGLKRPNLSSAADGILGATMVLLVSRFLFGRNMPGQLTSGNSAVFLIYLSIMAGVIEETLWRGYAIERLAQKTGRRWLTGLALALGFALVHLATYGPADAAKLLVPAAGFTVLFLVRRDLMSNIIAHSLYNVAAIFGFPRW
jgi:membrane protease YdiL (CAAX protease family)